MFNYVSLKANSLNFMLNAAESIRFEVTGRRFLLEFFPYDACIDQIDFIGLKLKWATDFYLSFVL